MKREIHIDDKVFILQLVIGIIIAIILVGLILGMFIDGWCRKLYFGWLNALFYGEYVLYWIRLIFMDSFVLMGLCIYIAQKSRGKQQAGWKRKVLNTICFILLLFGLGGYNRTAIKDLPIVCRGEYAYITSDDYTIKTSGSRMAIYNVVVQVEAYGKLEPKYIEVTKTQSQAIKEKRRNKETISFYYLPNSNILLKLESNII